MSASARLPRLALRVMAHVRRSWRAATAPVPGEADGQDLLSFAPSLIQFGALTAFAQNYVLAVMQCVGPSMLPTLGLSGDVVLMWPTASGLVKPQLGDVVICASPTDPTSTVCKRVVGLPGDVVRYRRLPGMPALPESATRSRDGHECLQQVPRGQCWLQGDNSADSCDSRYYGPVPLSLVRGIVFLKVWPFASLLSIHFLYRAEGSHSFAHVWWYGWVTALSTGLGAIPVGMFCMSSKMTGLSNAVAAGMMTAASAALIEEGLMLPAVESSMFSPVQAVIFGAMLGVAFVAITQYVLKDAGESAHLCILEEGIDARRALLIVLVMTVHSFSEGIGIGASFGGQTGSELGMLVTTTLAVHNVPEGFAVSSVLVSKGMSVWGAALWSTITSIPQPIMAVAAYSCVDAFVMIQPIGLGFAAGAMLWVAWLELFVESCEACGLLSTGAVGVTSASLMSLCHAYLIA